MMAKQFSLSAATALILGIALPCSSIAGEWDFGAEIRLETRYFLNDPNDPQQLEQWQPSLTLQPELRWEDQNRNHQLTFIPFFRFDTEDDERSHGDIKEAYYRYNSDHNWSLTIGAVKVFWGRTESRHLVDIINQTDGVEDIDGEDKLGQPMVNLSWLTDLGSVDFYVMPGFRERTFPGVEGRLRPGQAIDTDNPIFSGSEGRDKVDLAARYSHYIGNWDFGLSAFHGTSREPRLTFTQTSIRPIYDEISQASLGLQYTKDSWLWKLEALVREGNSDRFSAAVGGVEYTAYGFLDKGWDLGLLAEYQYDGRDDRIIQDQFGQSQAEPLALGNNDVFVGARLAFNDAQDSAALIGYSTDIEDQTAAMFIEAQKRIGENWRAELETRLFLKTDPQNPQFVLKQDDFATLRLTRFY